MKTTTARTSTKYLPRVLMAVSAALLGSVGLVDCVGDSTVVDSGGPDTGMDADLTGTEGHPCFANKTCLGGLTCVSNVCVNLGGDSGNDGPGVDAPADVAQDVAADVAQDVAPDVAADTGTDAAVAQPILQWSLDGNGNNTGTVSGYAMTLNGTTAYVTGKFGQGVQYGASSYGTVASIHPVLGAYAQYTISFWINASATPNTGSSMFDFENRFNAPYGGIQLAFGTTTQFSMCVSSTTASYLGGSCAMFNAPAANAWHNVILRYAGTGTGTGQGAGVDVYEDDVLVHNTPNDSNNNPVFNSNESSTLYVGTSGMTLDEIRVYNQVFTTAEQCTTVIGGTWANSTCTLP